MRYRNRYAKVNVKLLIILILVMAALGVSLVAARQIRRSVLSKMSLAAGEAAYQNKDWPAAAKNLREYLGRNPDNVEILKKYAKALLSRRPLESPSVGGVISAYRRVLQVDPNDASTSEELAMLYTAWRQFEDLAYIARMRLGHDPNNLKAPLWLAEALVQQNKAPEARKTLEEFIARLEKTPADKPAEYVPACVGMSQLVVDWKSEPARAEALKWLNQAVDSGADSARALAHRAQYYRRASALRDVDAATKSTLTGSAKKDLEAADAAGTDDPEILYFLGTEWMEHGELDRAAQELQALDKLPQEKLEEHFSDVSNWKAARFLFASELARLRGATAEAAALADDTLSVLTDKSLRGRVLPVAIPFYLAVNKVTEARKCLDEYLGLPRDQQGPTASPLSLARLEAWVETAENKPYAVIDTLQPVAVSGSTDPEMWRIWRLLADAYSRTNQTARAVNAQLQCLRFFPGDPQMLRELARQYSRMSDWNRTIETAKMAESAGATDLITKLLRIGAAINLAVGLEGKADAAKLKDLSAELDGLRQAQPDQVDIRIFQALIAGALEQPQEKEKLLKLAIDECKEPLKAEMQLAGHYLATKRIPEAINVCEAACKRDPGVAEPWMSLSDVYMVNSDSQAARKSLQQGLDAVSNEGEKRSLSLKLAMLELLQGDRTAGINGLEKLAGQDTKDIQARLLLLRTRISEIRRLRSTAAQLTEDQAVTKRLTEERAEAEKLIAELKLPEGEGQSGLQWRLLEASLWLLGDDWRSKQQEITDRLQYCIDADPGRSEPVLLLAGMYERLGDTKRVEDICRQALTRNPSAADVADRLLALLERQSRFAEAEKVLQQTQANPRLASAWHVRMALGSGDLSRAIDELKLRVSGDSQDASARIELARLIYQQTKDSGQALRYLKEAEALTPGARSLAAVKATVLREAGQTEEARRVLDQYVAEHNDFTAYWMRAVFLAEEGKSEQAENDYKKLTTFAQEGAIGYELLANFYGTTQRLDKAITALEEGRKAYPADQRLPRRLMQLLFQRARADDREKATEILTALEKELPPDPELMMVRVRQAATGADLTPESRKAAREKLEEIVKLQPTMIEAHLRLIDVALREGQPQAARDYAVRALGSNPNNSVLLSARGKTELALDNAQMAADLARLALRQDPNNADAIDVLAQAALAGTDQSLLEEARPLLEAGVGRDRANERLLFLRGQVLTVLKQPEKAIPELEAYCQTKPGAGSLTALVTLADLYRLAGNADQSKQWIDQAQRVDPNSQLVLHSRLRWLAWQKQVDELRTVITLCLSAKQQDVNMLVRTSSVLASSDSVELKKEGVRLFERAVALAPKAIGVQLGLASTLYQVGDVDRAKKIYEELLKQYPTSVPVINDLAWILQEHDHNYSAALELANKGIGVAPNDLHLLDTRGTILANLPQRLAEARSDFQKLVSLSPGDTRERAKALLQLGRVCVKLKDLPQAKQHLEEALKIDEKLHVFTPAERAEIAEIMSRSGI